MTRLCLSLGAALTVLAVAPAPARAQIGTLVSPGPLAKAHASLEGASNCEKCHEPGRKVTAERCLACHRPVAERIKAGKGVHRGVTECATCHVDHAGRDAELRPFDTKAFNHAGVTGFALDGRHAAVQCAGCHKTRSYLTAQTACASCHADPHKGRLGNDCARCHPVSVPFKQTGAAFDHGRTAYPLVGAHRTVPCAKCHANQVYRGLKFQLCTDCHKTPHRQPLGESCTSCHTPDTWRTQKIDHARTGYPLLGKHAAVACAACHVKRALAVRLKYDRCADCHSDPHKGVFKQDCGACHQVTGFGRTPFDHNATHFPLTGRHAGVDCRACHKNLPAAPVPPTARPETARPLPVEAFDFRGLSTDCVSCHMDVHRGDAGLKCEGCHTTAAFRPVSYAHPRQPEFFAGQHAGLACERCHRTGPAPTTPKAKDAPLEGWRFKNVSTACATCHADPHLGQVGSACESCHSIEVARFAVVKFTHARTAFPLTGKHQAVKCEQCHRRETAVFPAGQGTAVRLKGMPLSCRSCHADPHLGQVGVTCEGCHDTTTFRLTAYQHKPPVARLMVGNHAKLVCADCHRRVQGAFPAGAGAAVRYTGIGTQCSSCHEDAHRGGLGTACESCHSLKAAWRAASRSFHQTTNFPLEGRHQAVGCAQCHLNGITRGTPTSCYDCHWVRRQDDRYYTRLGSNCRDCHRPTSWTAVTWDHGAATGMPLGGAHRTIGCEGCHKDRQFVSLGRTCFSCHQADYNSTTNPSHAAAGFPTTCDTCHSASAATWATSFNHSAFYPLVGVHATQTCTACHANNVYTGTPTTCVGCHQAVYNTTTNPNHIAAGFPTTCDTCHKATDATWLLAVFNHSAYYALVGVHATQPCSACHKNNVYAGTPTDCYSCHQAVYNATTNPNHIAAGFPTTCDTCHKATDATWLLAVFNHTWFPIASGRHAGNPCSACHTNASNYLVFTCTTSCHPQASTTSNHQGVSGYTYASAACYSCHPNGSAGSPAPVPRLAVSHAAAAARGPDGVTARNGAGGALPVLRCVASHGGGLR